MDHSFNVEIASLLGIEEAIIMNNFFFWINKNAANEKHFHEERYWTYNTTKALSELIPYMSEHKISRVIKSLCEKDIIIKGNYNNSAYDRTCWYAFSDYGISILQKSGLHFVKSQNGLSETAKPIPDIIHIVNTNINTDKDILADARVNKVIAQTPRFDFKKAIIELGVKEQTANDWMLVRKAKKATNSKTAFERIKSEIIKSHKSPEECIRLSVEKDWKGFEAGWLNNQVGYNSQIKTSTSNYKDSKTVKLY